jgi:hypothetical protein
MDLAHTGELPVPLAPALAPDMVPMEWASALPPRVPRRNISAIGTRTRPCHLQGTAVLDGVDHAMVPRLTIFLGRNLWHKSINTGSRELPWAWLC